MLTRFVYGMYYKNNIIQYINYYCYIVVHSIDKP